MPRILRIINRFNLGGPTWNAAYLSKYLAPKYETMLIGGVPLPDEAHSGFILDDLEVPFREIRSMSRSINPFNDVRAFLAINRIIRDFRPDIIHTHAAKAGALGRIAAWNHGVPCVVHTYHGHVFEGYFSPWKSKLVRTTERFLARRSDAIVTISEQQRQDIAFKYRIAPSEKVHLIPLGFDLDRFGEHTEERRSAFRSRFHMPPDTLAIGIIGRLVPVKNHELFLRAIAELKEAGVRFRAFVIGDGSIKSGLEGYAESLGLSVTRDDADPADVVFTSWITEIETALPGLDIVALTSFHEGTPVSIIEAMAAGRAVISTDAGGVRNVIRHGETGLVIPQRDEPAFFEGLLRLSTDGHLREQLAGSAREAVIHAYHYRRLVSDMDTLYSRLLAGK